MTARKLYVLPYKAGSNSARELSRGLNTVCLKVDGSSRYRHNDRKLLINWGNTENPLGDLNAYSSNSPSGGLCLNPPSVIRTASNKSSFFSDILYYNATTEGRELPVHIPEFTTSSATASDWWNQGESVVCRKILSGHSGDGMVFSDPSRDEALVQARLYTKYIKKTAEYRVHAFKDGVIFKQRKVMRGDATEEFKRSVDWRLRNHSNGFIFQQNNVELPEHVEAMCVRAINVLGLDFGAVDVIYNQQQDKYYILEVNTAPGLTGNTLQAYIDKFSSILEAVNAE